MARTKKRSRSRPRTTTAKKLSAFLERGYYLTPVKEATKAYRLLADVMEKGRRAGIATFVMRDREYLVAIFAQNGILCAETLRSAASQRLSVNSTDFLIRVN
jgi:non-homologous end joining protein Ku